MAVFNLLSHQEKVKKYLGEAVFKGLLQMEVPEEKKEQFINFRLPLGEGKKDKETATMDPAI
eukprot:81588-Karenia_brevis.AAC.1